MDRRSACTTTPTGPTCGSNAIGSTPTAIASGTASDRCATAKPYCSGAASADLPFVPTLGQQGPHQLPCCASMPSVPLASPTRSRLALLTGVAHDERVALAWSFLYFFSLLCAYGLLRPLREEMGVRHGVAKLQWLFSGTFLCMLLAQPLYGALVSRFERRVFLPVVYGFFIACLLAFYAVFRLDRGMTVAVPAFFIWVSVFNLFVVSVFWSFMSDILTTDQAKRLYGIIAAGGTCGALAGP